MDQRRVLGDAGQNIKGIFAEAGGICARGKEAGERKERAMANHHHYHHHRHHHHQHNNKNNNTKNDCNQHKGVGAGGNRYSTKAFGEAGMCSTTTGPIVTSG